MKTHEINKYLWAIIDPCNHYDHLTDEQILNCTGYVPGWLADLDQMDLSAIECINKFYGHGGGWIPFSGFEISPEGVLRYPGDPPLYPLVQFTRKEETIRFYPHSWVEIEGQVARID